MKKIKGIENLRVVTPKEHRVMNKELISIKYEIKETIKLIRLLKYEVIELKKQGLASKVINKILLKKYSKKFKNYFR
jgi:hypothetical protein